MNENLLTILLVADNEDDIVIIKEALEETKFLRLLATLRDGEEALKYLRREGEYLGAQIPDLIFLDINMPKKNEFEVLDEIKAAPALEHIPVVMLTTSNDEGDIQKAYAKKACSYINKPGDPGKLREVLENFEFYWSLYSKTPFIPDLREIHILVIEDNPDDLRIIQEMLTAIKDITFHLQCADRLSVALELLTAGRYDVVLLDLSLPDSQGAGTFEKVRQHAPQLPIIILTGLDEERVAMRTVGGGAQDYLVKGSVDANLLIRSIRYAMERKRAEVRNLRDLEKRLEGRAAKLEAIAKEWESFSHSISHDLRAPLRSIQGFTQALVEDSSHLLDEQGKDHLQRVRAGARRMDELIDALLSLSRVTRTDLQNEPVNLTAIARTCILELQKIEPQRNVDARISEGLATLGDSRLVGLMLENLLHNAWKFTSRRPHPVIEFGANRRSDETVYFVRDNGAGFDMAYADRLFGAFQRFHAESEFPGTGIGLATVQRIIQCHGGRIWAEGVPDQGATFYFTLRGVTPSRVTTAPGE